MEEAELRKIIKSAIQTSLGNFVHMPDQKLAEEVAVTKILKLYRENERESEKRGVAWTIGIIDEMHEMDIKKNGGVRDSQYKSIKNGVRAMYEEDTGNGDPAPNYPINVTLSNTHKTGDK